MDPEEKEMDPAVRACVAVLLRMGQDLELLHGCAQDIKDMDLRMWVANFGIQIEEGINGLIGQLDPDELCDPGLAM